tara:strand:- start:50086 stop:50370 length:285 start_codon:yes stop_codon:yes gene_type:complete
MLLNFLEITFIIISFILVISILSKTTLTNSMIGTKVNDDYKKVSKGTYFFIILGLVLMFIAKQINYNAEKNFIKNNPEIYQKIQKNQFYEENKE